MVYSKKKSLLTHISKDFFVVFISSRTKLPVDGLNKEKETLQWLSYKTLENIKKYFEKYLHESRYGLCCFKYLKYLNENRFLGAIWFFKRESIF